MKAISQRRLLWAMAMLPLLVTCSESPVQPEKSGTIAAQAGLRVKGKLAVVKRGGEAHAALGSATIGKNGGVISAGGVTLSIPAGALSSSVYITMAVPANGMLTVDLQPHGLRFQRAATLSFTLKGTGYDRKSAEDELIAAYHSDGIEAAAVTPRELMPIRVERGAAIFDIWHFSQFSVTLSKGLIMVGG